MLPHAQALVEKVHVPVIVPQERPDLFPPILKLDNIDTVGYQAMLPPKKYFGPQHFHQSLVSLVPQQALFENPHISSMFPEKK